MLQITARLYDVNGNLKGYQITDGKGYRILSKVQIWVLAKNKEIANVSASGTRENPQIYGVNGFELKKLPDIKQNRSKVVSTPEILSAGIRALICGYAKAGDNILEAGDKMLENDLFGDRQYLFDRNLLQHDLKILYRITYISKEEERSKRARKMKPEPHTVGYVVKYFNNDEPLRVSRIAVDGSTYSTLLYPGKKVCLSRAELALLASERQVTGKFKNGVITRPEKDKTVCDNFVEELWKYDFNENKGETALINKPLVLCVNKETANKYFIRV